ncbi:MAG: Fur family transcriptional regulator [Candidatus Loosdrechtia sp.]|uniref:Fur family transcriptional regulator n=1 Tax=Candidatus Loosdrechtia sp. TaxID=3101272 RepID=UPI003A79D744|nr:MAG: transcriptional repressor [Candidatus Jettenia sp. AMX2]
MESVEKLTKVLRNNGMKITPQRLLIFNVLENNTSHPSAEEVFNRVKKVYPTVSFTTIYKTLETLRDLGEVRELIIDEDRKHYDPNMNIHHHVICSSCKKIHDIYADYSSHIKLPESIKNDYAVSGFQISFYGICRACR